MRAIIGIGDPGGRLKSVGTEYIDKRSGKVYVQRDAPSGRRWTEVDLDISDDASTVQFSGGTVVGQTDFLETINFYEEVQVVGATFIANGGISTSYINAENYYTGNFVPLNTIYASLSGASFSGNVVFQSISPGYRAVTSTTTATTTDHTIHATSGTFTIHLPTVSAMTNIVYVIKNTGSGTITVQGNSGQLIDSGNTISITQYNKVTVQNTGSMWIIIG